MKVIYSRLVATITIVLCFCLQGTSFADSNQPATPNGLGVSQIKITGDEFVMLVNNSDSAINDLSSFWLTAYNNTNPLTPGVTSSSQQLPAVALAGHAGLLLSTTPMPTCGASIAGKLSVSLSDAAGFLQVSQFGLASNGAVTSTPGDMVSWSSGPSGQIQNVPSSTKAPRALYYRYVNGGSFAWQQAEPSSANSCQLNIVVAGGSVSSTYTVTPLALAVTSPPATILGQVTNGSAANQTPGLPAGDEGLLAPQLSELLPNPIGTGNDGTDEYIELYNPNDTAYDLSGFILQTGVTTYHSYQFPSGTILPPQGFQAFYASQTGLSLSNTTSQVGLLDPLGRVVASSDVYRNAKEGNVWILANQQWQWSTVATPNKANVVQAPVTASKKASSSKLKTAVLAPGKTIGTGSSTPKGPLGQSTNDQTTPSKTGSLLALIGVGALLYGAYEYRHDLTNRLFQLRAKFSAR